MINVEVKNKKNESGSNLLRRFSRRVNNAGVLSRARSLKYRKRNPSNNIRKKQALRRKKRLEEVERMIKLGKLPDRRKRKSYIRPEDEEKKR